MRRAHRRRTLLLGLAALLTVLALVVPLVGAVRRRAGRSSSSGPTRARRARASTCRASIRRPARCRRRRWPPRSATPVSWPPVADGRFLYAVSEVDAVDGTPGGAVAGYAIDKAAGHAEAAEHAVDGRRRPVPRQRRRQDGLRRQLRRRQHRRLSDAGRRHAEAGVDVRPAQGLERQQGSAEADRTRTASRPIRSGKFLYVPDLGLDQVLVYRIDAAAGTIAPADAAVHGDHAGRLRTAPHRDQPRRQARLRDHRDVLHDRRVRSQRHERRAVAGPDDQHAAGRARRSQQGFSTAEVLLHPSGKFLYGSNRGHDSLVVYAVDASTGKLTLVQHVPTGGKTPRAFNIDPTGTFLVVGNQNSDHDRGLQDRSRQRAR